MINNTCNLNIPYFLTANHCFAGDNNVAQWRFVFQYMSSQCLPNQDDLNNILFNGSTLRANSSASDFCLVELNQTPDATTNINYAGWNRSSTAASNATGIHHPRGDVMKISTAATSLTVASAFGTINQHWRADWTQGVTEPGSSGSPLFDQNHRIVGQLHGGPSACGSGNLLDFYGRFDLSWTGGGTNATRLSNWLDPSNTGTITTNTISVATIGTYLINGNVSFCTTSNNYTINNLPVGAIVQWTTSPQGIATPNTPNAQQTSLARIADGVITLTATITNVCGGPYTITKGNINVGGPQIELVTFSNGANGEGYFCTSHNGNQFEPVLSFTPASCGIEYRLLSYPSLNVVYTDPTLYACGAISVGSNFAPGWYVLETRLTTDCGTSAWTGYEVEFVDCSVLGGGNQYFSVSASPNPVESDLYVRIDKEKQEVKSLGKDADVYFKLYDFYTKHVVKQWRFKNDQDQRTLKVSDVKPGQYILSVSKGKYSQSMQIIIQ